MVPLERLRQCPALATLPSHRLRAAARASREETYQAGETVPLTSDRLYILQEGEIVLHVHLCPGTRCGGAATIAVHRPGHLFGWQSFVKEERLQIQMVCSQPTRVVAINLARLRSSETGLLLLKQAAGCLYALLQDIGLCPHNATDSVLLGAEQCQWMDAEKPAEQTEKREK